MRYLVAVLAFFYFLSVPLVDAKLLPRYQKKSSGRQTSTSSFYVSPRLRADRRAIIIYFGNLNQVNSATYNLFYQADGVDQGVSGSVDSSGGNSTSRELDFGTCSSGDCRYHGNISNMKLEIQADLTSGRRATKRYRIRP